MAGGDESTDDSQKTEEPTARRLQDARQRGQVVHSREINTWVMLFAAAVLFVMSGPTLATELKETLRAFIEYPEQLAVSGTGLHDILSHLTFSIAKILLIPLLLVCTAGVIASFLQTGPLFTWDPISPSLEKISVTKGLQRLFSKRSVVELIKSMVKLIIISIAVAVALKPYVLTVEHFVDADIVQSLSDLRDIFLKLMTTFLSVLFVIAILDYVYQREAFLKQMRMSKQELKDEFKQTEGDPHIKGKLRQMREKQARKRMMQAVPKADVVITNPTHYAVALQYNSQEMAAPILVAKGIDLVAQKIKEIAKENKVPIVENPFLARTLFEAMDIDETIPQEHWKAVAEIISYVFKLKNKKVQSYDPRKK